MAEGENPRGERRPKKKLRLKVKTDIEYTEYEASYDCLQIDGITIGDKNDVKLIVRRIISAPREPPEFVVKAGVMVTNHISGAINSRAREAWAGVGVEFGDNESLRLSASLHFYIDDDTEEAGWVGEAKADFSGFDGYMVDSSHSVVKRLSFGKEVDVMAVYRALLVVARHAYNAYPS